MAAPATARVKLSKKVQDDLVLSHLDVVKKIAKGVHATLPESVQLDDLIQEGTIGLVKAAQDFNSAISEDFVSYAKYKIRGAILESLREVDYLSRHARQFRKSVEKVKKELSDLLGTEPTEEQIKQRLQLSDKEWTRGFLQSYVFLLSLSQPVRKARFEKIDLTKELKDMSAISNQENTLVQIDVYEILERLVSLLPFRLQISVRHYYFNELTMKEIGARFGVIESNISQRLTQARKILRGQLAELGIKNAF